MKFSSFNLSEYLISCLEKEGYVDATEVQFSVIPKALRGENIIAQSETGSGKTHSFLIPILNNLTNEKTLQDIIVCPTRELAKQTFDFFSDFNKYFPYLSVKLFVSGKDTSKDLKSIIANTKIIVATPGRLKALLENTDIDFSHLRTIVLDEADMLFESGFIEDIDKIISYANNPQIEVFSATISKNLAHFIKKYINADYIFSEEENSLTSKNVKHFAINDKHKNIKELLISFIKIKNPYKMFVFTNSKVECKEFYDFLCQRGFNCGILSGELQPRERRAMIKRIKNDEFPIIVCTDIASRGIDIENVTDVVSTSLPNNLEYYFHRAGRTGRYKEQGESYFFYNQDSMRNLELLKSKGCEIEFLKIVNDELVKDNFDRKRKNNGKNKELSELEITIKKIKNENKSKKVKPNYKKKVKVAIDKAKRKHKREIIKKDIRRQRVERYKKESKTY